MRKNYTFIVTSDQKSQSMKFVLPASWVKFGIIAATILVLLGSAAIVDYTGLLIQSIENKRLKAENAFLKSQFDTVESKMQDLEKDLSRITTYASKLKLITGPSDGESSVRLAMGPFPQNGQSIEEMNEDIDSRGPASNLGVYDKEFLQEPPLEVKSGEIFSNSSRNYATIAVRVDKLKKESNLREQDMIVLLESLSSRLSLLQATPSLNPTNGWFTSKFGYRRSPFTGRLVMHAGLDIAANPGTPVLAPADGIVSFSGFDGGYGKLISIDHGRGIVTRYGHLSKIYTQIGQKIKRGDMIGAVGNTGRSTGPHLHYEVRMNGIPVNPTNYILYE